MQTITAPLKSLEISTEGEASGMESQLPQEGDMVELTVRGTVKKIDGDNAIIALDPLEKDAGDDSGGENDGSPPDMSGMESKLRGMAAGKDDSGDDY